VEAFCSGHVVRRPMMAGIMLRKGKANGLVNMYVAVPVGDTTHISTDRLIFIPVPADTTFKACVDALTE
jgi:hypothetical protein